MSELMEDDVMTVAWIGGATPDIPPGQDDGTVVPGFAQSDVLAFDEHAADEALDVVGNVAARVDQYRRQTWVIVGAPVQQQKAGLNRDGYTDFVGDFEPAATFEAFLRQKNLRVTQ